MPRDRDDAAYVYDMLRFARVVRDLVAGKTVETYRTDLAFQLAVERAIEIVGQAAREVSPEFEASHPEVPWQKIIAQRHVLAHRYGDIDPEKMWRVATAHIPALIAQLELLVPPPPPDPEPDTPRQEP